MFTSEHNFNLKYFRNILLPPFFVLLPLKKVTLPAKFAAFLDAERTKWGAVIKQAGVKIE